MKFIDRLSIDSDKVDTHNLLVSKLKFDNDDESYYYVTYESEVLISTYVTIICNDKDEIRTAIRVGKEFGYNQSWMDSAGDDDLQRWLDLPAYPTFSAFNNFHIHFYDDFRVNFFSITFDELMEIYHNKV